MATFAARLPAASGAVARSIVLSRRFAEAAALPAGAADQLAIVVEECVVNLLEHGRPPPGSRIALRLDRAEGCVRLTVSDAGRPFDPRDAAFDGPNLDRGGGAGLALIKAWCRVADYTTARGRNRLVLELPT